MNPNSSSTSMITKKQIFTKIEEPREYPIMKKGSSYSFNSGISSEADSINVYEKNTQEINAENLKSKKIKRKSIENEKEKKKYNDWKPEEDLILLELCNSKYQKKWKKISSIIGNKTPRMCAYRIRKLKKYVKYQDELNKKKIFGLQDENKELNKITIPEKMIQNEIENNGFINFKKMRKKRTVIKKTKIEIFNENKYKKLLSHDLKGECHYHATLSCFSYLKIEDDNNQNEINEENTIISDFSRKNDRHLTVGDINMAPEIVYYENHHEKTNEKSSTTLLYWAFSRKNSPDVPIDSQYKGDFQKAYKQVFDDGYVKQKSIDSILNKGEYVEEEKNTKPQESAKYEDYITFNDVSDSEYNEVKVPFDYLRKNEHIKNKNNIELLNNMEITNTNQNELYDQEKESKLRKTDDDPSNSEGSRK